MCKHVVWLHQTGTRRTYEKHLDVSCEGEHRNELRAFSLPAHSQFQLSAQTNVSS